MSLPLTASPASSRSSPESASAARPIPLAVLGLALVNLVILAILPFLQLGDGTNIPRLALFMGRFHPVVLHVPIGIILLAILLEHAHVRGLRRWIPKIHAGTSTFLIFFAAMSAAVSTVLGWMLSYSGGYEPGLLQRHFIAGLATAIGANLALVVKLISDARPTARVARYSYQFILLATGACLGLAGHWGASITHGEDYLTEFAPDSVRHLLGLPVRIDPASLPWKPLPERVAFNEVVEPILNDRCVGCHSGQKAKGGLRLDRYDLVMKGGNTGAAVVPSESAKSLMLRYIDLPEDDEKHMPPKGKTQLSDDEQAVLAWWVGAGAPDEKTIGSLTIPVAAEAAMERAVPEAIRLKQEAAQRAEAAKVAAALGPLRKGLPGSLRMVVPGEPNLEYAAGADYAQVTDAQLHKLEPVSGYITLLALARTGVSDTGLELVAKMPVLSRLEIQETNTGDAGLQKMGTPPALEVLNLYDTHVTDKGLALLAAMPKLRRLYVGRTRVTAAGIENLRKRMPHLEIVREEVAKSVAKAPLVAATPPVGVPHPEKKPQAARPIVPEHKAAPKAAAAASRSPGAVVAVTPKATQPLRPAASPARPAIPPAPSATPISKTVAPVQAAQPAVKASLKPAPAVQPSPSLVPISKTVAPVQAAQPAVKASPKPAPAVQPSPSVVPISKTVAPVQAAQPAVKASPKAAPAVQPSPSLTPPSKTPLPLTPAKPGSAQAGAASPTPR